ncbi:hypothetical protein QFZ82_006817 [Streptomyces sp. V4I23]|uniref:hypothetical protein n=1 Tax=Streptomyces sp. V4I23 TaxID=3042282 RepID=UPI002784D140|nr:hypothetical protein [Streptomyces sp. V4I23]MDQ1012332.1 hypothetical protein [Streptomyces sp. V4I23]
MTSQHEQPCIRSAQAAGRGCGAPQGAHRVTWRQLPVTYGAFGAFAPALLRRQRSCLWDQIMEALEGVPGTPLPGEIHLPPLQV